MISSKRPPDLSACREVVLELLTGNAGLFLDIDGTLSPIQPDPAAVTITQRIRGAIDRLSQKLNVVLLSGRGVSDAYRIVALDGVTYAGNHGVEWRVNGVTSLLPEAEEYVTAVRHIAAEAVKHFAGWRGVFVEDKGPSLSIHYRGTRDPAAAGAAIDAFYDAEPEASGLRRSEGKMVKELRPPIQADKGVAVRRVVGDRGLVAAAMFGETSMHSGPCVRCGPRG